MDAFIGRATEREAITNLFRGGAQLVCLTGTVGIGKTRLAREWLGDGGTFVELVDAQTADDLCEEIACELGLGPNVDLVSWLANAGSRTIVLDQFEHLIDSAATLLEEWMVAAPETRWLVTSRQPLHLDPERLVELNSLRVRPREDGSLSEAAQLLLARARQVEHAYSVTAADESIVEQIVEQLEGIPLALELAAPRLVLLGPKTLLANLGERLRLLDARGGALQTTLQWSWSLLSAAEQSVLAQASIFRGGFTPEAAEAIIAWDGEPDLEDVLHQLVDKSLVHRTINGRFGIYWTVAEFAAEQLSEALRHELAQRHAQHYAAKGQALMQALLGSEAADSRRAYLRERDNLRAAAISATNADIAATIASLIGTAALLSGRVDADEKVITDAMEGDSEFKDELFLKRGLIRLELGRIDDAAQDLFEARRLAEIADHHRVESESLRAYARVLFYRGELAKAEKMLLYEALPIAEAFQDVVEAARVRVTVGVLQGSAGNVPEALSSFSKAIELFAQADALREQGVSHGIHAYWLATAGDYEKAREEVERAKQIQLDIATESDTFQTALVRGQVQLAAKDYSAAINSLKSAAAAYEQIGAKHYHSICIGYLGLAYLLGSGDLKKARDHFVQALDGVRAAGSTRDTIRFGAFAGGCAARLGEPNEAQKLLQEAAATARSLGDRLLGLTVAVQRAFLVPAEATQIVESARVPAAGIPAPTAVSLDVLFSVRTHDEAGEAPQPAAASDRLFIDRTRGQFARPGSNDIVDLSRRTSLRQILLGLVDAKINGSPGLRREDLVALGWPGQQLEKKSATNRLHLAISALRKLGLYDVIVLRDGLYSIHPAIAIREAEE